MEIAEYHSKASDEQRPDTAFESLYISVRRQEGRALTDEQVFFLPHISASHPHHNEWQTRKRSSERLMAALVKMDRPLNILEIGCGNGWLSAKLSGIVNAKVIGLDINKVEITLAKRVFKRRNLDFVWNDFDPDLFSGAKFDVILFAASIPYFPSLKSILKKSLTCLTEKGEIHIIDTHFYKANEIESAVTRMENYYVGLGYPEMSGHYFHHPISELQGFNYKLLINPRSIFNRLNKREPFYWVTITH